MSKIGQALGRLKTSIEILDQAVIESEQRQLASRPKSAQGDMFSAPSAVPSPIISRLDQTIRKVEALLRA